MLKRSSNSLCTWLCALPLLFCVFSEGCPVLHPMECSISGTSPSDGWSRKGVNWGRTSNDSELSLCSTAVQLDSTGLSQYACMSNK